MKCVIHRKIVKDVNIKVITNFWYWVQQMDLIQQLAIRHHDHSDGLMGWER